MIRPALPSDTSALVELAISTGLFTAKEADALLRTTLDAAHAGSLGQGHEVRVLDDDATGRPAGWTYLAPDANADRVWNLWWIGVAPSLHGRGIGASLLAWVEDHATNAGGRILLIETSSLAKLARTRAFYAKRAYVACGQVPDFYAAGDDKVIFVRRLSTQRPPHSNREPFSGQL